MRTTASVILAIVLCALAAACSDSAPAPPASTGTRIVALSPAVAVTLRSLGRQHEIVGRHGSDLILDERLPVCGDQLQIDYEALINARPTHVFIQWGARELPERLRTLAAERAWVLRDCRLLNLEDIEREASELDRLLAGTPEGSPEGAMVREHFQTALRARPGLAALGRVLLLGGMDPPGALGPGSCHHDVLIRLGAKPAITTGTAWQQLSLEDVRTLAPDVIVLILPRSPRTAPRGDREAATLGDGAMARLGSLASLDVPAVRHRRVVLIDDPLAHLPATSMADVAEQLAQGLELLPK